MDKNKNNRRSLLKDKGAVIGMILCFAAVLVMAGSFTARSVQKKQELQSAKEKEQAGELRRDSREAAANEIIIPAKRSARIAKGEKEPEVKETVVSGGAVKIWFDEGSILHWPASGGVLIPFSMDRTVYFPTLKQYRYNPAMIIAGAAGETINACAPGIVVNVGKNARTGVTVTLNMGNGYVAVYGQLKNVDLAQGDYVEENGRIGELCEPTKYYSLDGPNLYFEMQRDGVPVDPQNYMEP